MCKNLKPDTLNFEILSCMSCSAKWGHCDGAVKSRKAKTPFPFIPFWRIIMLLLGSKVSVKTGMHLYAFVIICYGMYAFVPYVMVSEAEPFGGA